MKERKYVKAIARKKLSIYDFIETGDPDLWIPTSVLENILQQGLTGLSLTGLALRTRSKVVKQKICKLLGYEVPESFRRTQPKFPGQNFDTYVQKANNLQIWNEDLNAARRYVIIKVSKDDKIEKIKVVSGQTLSSLDTTGTLTQKYQARIVPGKQNAELLVDEDTKNLSGIIANRKEPKNLHNSPTDFPEVGKLLTIKTVFHRLRKLIGAEFIDPGIDQERLRGAFLHKLVCKTLGYRKYEDDGQFPDLKNQLLEIKLQTSTTIDLGLVLPTSREPIGLPDIGGVKLRHCDVRYAIFYAEIKAGKVKLTHLFFTTGESFFRRFIQFGGKVLNKKLQIPLPGDFFDR